MAVSPKEEYTVVIMSQLETNKIDKNSAEYKEKELRRRVHNIWNSAGHRIWDETRDKDSFIKKFSETILELVPEATTVEMKRVRQDLSTVEGEENLISMAGEIGIKIMAKYLTLKEIERRNLKRFLEREGGFELSRGLVAKVNDQERSRIDLHVPLTFFDTGKEWLESFKAGLKTLADKLANEPSLSEINDIVGWSSLVKDNPRIFRHLGFDVTLDQGEKATEEVRISRAKLIEFYGK